MKKYNFIILFLFFLLVPSMVSAKTVADLKRELTELENSLSSNEQKKQLTEQEIITTNKNIGNITTNIAKSEEEIAELNSAIEKMNEDISRMDEEIKNIVNYAQVSEGESAYLEYAFGAKDFTDFIYRTAVAQQLADYNDKLITEYNKLIVENNQKKEDLNIKIVNLGKQSEKLKNELVKLEGKMSEINEVSLDVKSQIKLQKEAIKLYEHELKCKDDEDISNCGKNKLPADTKFWRPLAKGYVTSEYGWRLHPTKSYYTLHSGIDLSTRPKDNVPVYSTAKGMVAGITYKSSCGGTMIFIHHNVNGQNYTSVYMHLRKVLVNVGDVVTSNTQIAVMGGDPSVETWDSCSTGAHLHFTLAKGLYLKEYTSWSTLNSNTLNPRTIVNFPSYSFDNRTTRY